MLLSPIAWGGVSDHRAPATLTAAQAATCGVAQDSKEVSNADGAVQLHHRRRRSRWRTPA